MGGGTGALPKSGHSIIETVAAIGKAVPQTSRLLYRRFPTCESRYRRERLNLSLAADWSRKMGSETAGWETCDTFY